MCALQIRIAIGRIERRAFSTSSRPGAWHARTGSAGRGDLVLGDEERRLGEADISSSEIRVERPDSSKCASALRVSTTRFFASSARPCRKAR